HSAAILSIPKKISKKRRAFRCTNYMVNKEEFLPTVEDLWNKELNGHKMYKVVQKGKLKAAQEEMVEKPHDKDVKSGLVVGFQKANVEWISSGDRNTKHFYKVIASKRNISRIMSVCNDKGERFEGNLVADQFVQHFQRFPGNNEEGIAMNTEKFFINRLSDEEAAKMVIDVTDKEIKEAMFDIGENKAPGPDGFTSAFFKHSWKIIGKESAFILRRVIHDYLLTTQELLKGYNCKNGASRCALKIDIAKAYDTLISTVLSTMQTYWASVLLILKTVVKEIDRILKKFLWSHGSVNKVIWFTQCNPRCAFILWMAIQEKLATQDKMMKWSKDQLWCPLCKQCNDSHEHLFFKCEFFKTIWDGVKDKMYLGRISNDWGDIVKRITDLPCNNSIRSVLRRFVLATSVYYIWKERNSRLFSSDIKKVDILLHNIKENIRLQLQGLKVKESKQVKIVTAEWNEKRVFGWQFNIEMLFTQKQLVMNPDSSESLIGNATYWNGMLDMAWISSSSPMETFKGSLYLPYGGLPALAGGHLSDAFTIWFQLEDNSEGNVAKRDCFPEQPLSK
ncbi:RNA-directed DNA polymerase, eukaryota, reverse transcriptase zinc-binding domain protein, partial [Tanacetum coccineum]